MLIQRGVITLMGWFFLVHASNYFANSVPDEEPDLGGILLLVFAIFIFAVALMVACITGDCWYPRRRPYRIPYA